MRYSLLSWTFIAVFILELAAPPAHAEIPRKLAFQGRLANAQGQPLSGNQTLIFRLFDTSAGGTRLWEETQTVAVSSGLFSTALGNAATLQLPFDRPYWVEIQVGAEILAPRQPLTSSPYALRAQALDGIYAASGRVGIGTANPESTLDVRGHVAAYANPGQFVQLWNDNALIWGSAAYEGGLRLGKADNQAAGGWNEFVRIAGNGNVGIGTTNPGTKLHVAGNLQVDSTIHSSAGGTDSWFPYTDGNTYIRGALAVDSRPPGYAPVLRVLENGTVGIGTTSPRAPLSVMATIQGLSTGLELGGQHTVGVTAGGVINSNDAGGTVRPLTLQSNGGPVGIGTSTPVGKLDVAGNVVVDYLRVDPQNTSTEGGEIQLAGAGGFPTWQIDIFQDRFRLHSNGNQQLIVTHGGTAYAPGGFVQGSSIRLKTDLHRLTPAEEQALLAKLSQVSLYHYRLKTPDGFKKRHLGVIAEESPAVLVDDQHKAISTSDYLAALLAAVKAQQAQIEELRKEVARLKAR